MPENNWHPEFKKAVASRDLLKAENARLRDGFAKLEMGCKHLAAENARLRAALLEIKTRLHFVCMPQEPMHNGAPDWRRQIAILESALAAARPLEGGG